MNKDELFKIQSNTLNIAIGDVLISEPFMNDFHFRRSVILIIDHNEEGSLGVIFFGVWPRKRAIWSKKRFFSLNDKK